jgi:hypothetical protein
VPLVQPAVAITTDELGPLTTKQCNVLHAFDRMHKLQMEATGILFMLM